MAAHMHDVATLMQEREEFDKFCIQKCEKALEKVKDGTTELLTFAELQERLLERKSKSCSK